MSSKRSDTQFPNDVEDIVFDGGESLQANNGTEKLEKVQEISPRLSRPQVNRTKMTEASRVFDAAEDFEDDIIKEQERTDSALKALEDEILADDDGGMLLTKEDMLGNNKPSFTSGNEPSSADFKLDSSFPYSKLKEEKNEHAMFQNDPGFQTEISDTEHSLLNMKEKQMEASSKPSLAKPGSNANNLNNDLSVPSSKLGDSKSNDRALPNPLTSSIQASETSEKSSLRYARNKVVPVSQITTQSDGASTKPSPPTQAEGPEAKPEKRKCIIKSSKNYRQILASKTNKAMKCAANVVKDTVKDYAKDSLPDQMKGAFDEIDKRSTSEVPGPRKRKLSSTELPKKDESSPKLEKKDLTKKQDDKTTTSTYRKERKKCQIKTSKTYKQILEEKTKKAAKFAAKKAQEAALEYASEYIPQPAAKMLNDTLKNRGFAAPEPETKKKKRRKKTRVTGATARTEETARPPEHENSLKTVETGPDVGLPGAVEMKDVQEKAEKPSSSSTHEETAEMTYKNNIKTSETSEIAETKDKPEAKKTDQNNRIIREQTTIYVKPVGQNDINTKSTSNKKEPVNNNRPEIIIGVNNFSSSCKGCTTWNITSDEKHDVKSLSNDANDSSSYSEYTTDEDEPEPKPKPKVQFKMPGMGSGGDGKDSKVTAIVSNVSKCTSVGGIAKTVAPALMNGVMGNAKVKKAWQSTGGKCKCKCCDKCCSHCDTGLKILLTLISITVVVYDVAMAWVAFIGYLRFEGRSPLTIMFGIVCSIATLLMGLEVRNAFMSCLTNTLKVKRLQKLGQENKLQKKLIREERWVEIVSLLELLLGDFPIMIILALTISYASCGLYNATFKKGIVGKLSLYAVCISALWKGLLSFFQFCLSKPFKKGEEGAPSYLWTIFRFIKPLLAMALLFFALYILLTINGVYLNLTGRDEARTDCLSVNVTES